jgi:hypothetical integral membrane protein (TIGR02206 family)
MFNFFDFIGTQHPFRLFSASHIIPNILIIVFNIFIYYFFKKNNNEYYKKIYRYVLAIIIILQEILFTIWNAYNGILSLSYSLPLYLCSMAVIMSFLMLLTKSKTIFDLNYFWAIAATIPALITPFLGNFDFPHFRYFEFFVVHGGIISAIFFMIFIEKFRPTWKSVLKGIILTTLYIFFIFLINYIINANYLFLSRKPDGITIMNLLGDGPIYIIELAIITYSCFIVLYLPYFLYDLINRNKTDK